MVPNSVTLDDLERRNYPNGSVISPSVQGTNRKRICDFLVLINTNLPQILHCLRDTAFDRSKIAIFGYPSSV